MKSTFLLAALAIQLVTLAASQAAISYSGLQDIPISTTLEGTYLDMDTGMSAGLEFAGWDINPFFGGEAVGNSAAFQPVRASTDISSNILNLSLGYTVDASLIYASGMAGSSEHIGNGLFQFANGVEGYIGFKFTPIGNVDPVFGWMRLQLNNDSNTGLIRDWAIETSGASIQVGAIPEPHSILTAIISIAFMTFSRRRR